MPKCETNSECLSVLIVEDVQDSRDILSDIMRYRCPNVRLFVADNGETGIESFVRNQPDIVITDINMPIADGLSMAAEIKATAPATELIVLTAYSETRHLLKAIEIGVSHFIQKPIDTEKFFKVINKVLTSVRSEREIARQNEVIRTLNAELLQKTEELEQANRELESYDYTVAHDLRSPMVTIRTLSQRLLDAQGNIADSTAMGCVETIHRESVRLDNLVDALLRFSIRARKHPEKRRTNLSDMAHEISRNLLEKEHRNNVTFVIEDAVNGYCDPDLIRIILENLLGNAWKYSAVKDDVRIEFGTINTEEDLVYFVRDNGPGFDEQECERIFAPFQRLQNGGQADGFGIGLATSYRIIHRHGGRIWCDAAKGKGATFFFSL